ncbi:MAG: hypothetical protein JRH10_21650, partial [Deltaproteobacteria bacterium]|nr:hypothetical protein [Deltaproteobacteria bacterium]
MSQSLPLHSISRVSREAGRGGSRFLKLFSLPFCGVGVFMAGAVVTRLGQGQAFDADLALRAVFAVTFGAVGFGLLFLSRWTAAQTAAQQALRARHPDEPWRWRPEWATGRIPAVEGGTAVVASVVALVWNAMTAPMLFVLPAEIQKGNWPVLWALLFPAVGLGLVVWAARAVIRRRRFGRCVLELTTLPGVVGGPIRGTVHIPTPLRPSDGFATTLTCVHRVVTGHGKNRSTAESVVWRAEALIPPTQVMSAPVGSAFGVEFTVPGDAQPSSPEPSDDEILWRFAASASVPGVDFATTFEIPVFHTEASDETLEVDEPLGEPLSLSVVPTPVADESRITAAAIAGGVELYFPAARSPSGATMLTVFALVWNGILAPVALFAPPIALVFLSIFFLVGFCIVLGALDAWFGTIRMQVRRGELEVRRTFLGVAWTRTHRSDEIESLVIEPTGHLGTRVFYGLKLHRRGRKRPSTLADG